MEKLIRDLLGRLKALFKGNEERSAEVPYHDRYADEIRAFKVVRDALLVR